jgi:hypothetical protein
MADPGTGARQSAGVGWRERPPWRSAGDALLIRLRDPLRGEHFRRA